MTKNEFLIQALLSLNKGDCGYADVRVNYAVMQYNQLVKAGVKFDEETKKDG